MQSKWFVVFLILGVFICTSSNADARGSHRRPPIFHYRPLPGYYKNLASSRTYTPTYTTPIYHQKEYTPPRIYTIEKPLVNDPQIYRPLNIQQEYAHLDFYRYDKERNQYVAPNVLHANARAALTRRSTAVEINGQTFYYTDGFFYKENGEHFIVVPPVIDSIVKKIPESSVSITGGRYEHNGIYFQETIQGYQVIGRPLTGI